MDILHTDNGKNGVFYAEHDGSVVAEMTYVWSGNETIIIDRTAVSEVLEGKGMGKKLLYSAIEMAREKQIKILPLCPFSRKVFNIVGAYKDVLLDQ